MKSSLLYTKVLFLVMTTSSTAAAFAQPGSSSRPSAAAAAATGITKLHAAQDTPDTLPDFTSQQEYLDYMEGVSALPKGFATGTASGTFISKEAPSMGKLPIKGTVIYLTEGPTDNWAAVFTKNKVRLLAFCVYSLSNSRFVLLTHAILTYHHRPPLTK